MMADDGLHRALLDSVIGADPVAAARALCADPEAVEVLRQALGVPSAQAPLAYTVVSLAKVTGLSPRAIRGAVGRGELAATRRGGGRSAPFLIAARDAAAWLGDDSPVADLAHRRRSRRGAQAVADAFAALDHY